MLEEADNGTAAKLAEIEARVERWEVKGTVEGDIDGEPWGVEGVVGIAVTMRESDYDWLLARVRELEAQAARDAKVVEAAKHLSYVMPIAERYVPTRQQVPLRQLRAALAARGEG